MTIEYSGLGSSVTSQMAPVNSTPYAQEHASRCIHQRAMSMARLDCRPKHRLEQHSVAGVSRAHLCGTHAKQLLIEQLRTRHKVPMLHIHDLRSSADIETL
jgi:hypothetical protein